jgi:hypothetical protein
MAVCLCAITNLPRNSKTNALIDKFATFLAYRQCTLVLNFIQFFKMKCVVMINITIELLLHLPQEFIGSLFMHNY